MRTVMAGYTSPFWMTVPQANSLDAKIRKGERSSVVVYSGKSRSQKDDAEETNDGDPEEARVFRFQKSYRVFNADQIDGLPEAFHPDPCPLTDHPPAQPIPAMQAFFDAIGITTVFSGTEARYNPPVDKVFIPSIERFKNPLNFYGVWAHELAHATKVPHRLNRDYGLSRFGNTAYSREEIVAELTSCFLGQELGFTAHTIELNASHLYHWLRVLRSDKAAIFKHAAEAQHAAVAAWRPDLHDRQRWVIHLRCCVSDAHGRRVLGLQGHGGKRRSLRIPCANEHSQSPVRVERQLRPRVAAAVSELGRDPRLRGGRQAQAGFPCDPQRWQQRQIVTATHYKRGRQKRRCYRIEDTGSLLRLSRASLSGSELISRELAEGSAVLAEFFARQGAEECLSKLTQSLRNSDS